MIKCAVIYYAGFLRYGGVLSHVRAMERELIKMGWDVSVVTLDSLPIYVRYIPHFVERVINFINRPLGYFYKDRTTRFLYKLFFDKKVDVRIFEDVYVAWNSEVPSITILHAVWSDNLQSHSVSSRQKEKLIKNEAKVIDKISHSVVTVSNPYLEYIKSDHFSGCLQKKIDVVELGIDQSIFLRSGNRNIKSIVYVGVLEARKNILFLLKVFKRLVEIDDGYKLTVIGDGPDRSILEDFVKINKLNVNFLGALNHTQVVSQLYFHGIYLHTSVKESFSYSLLEAKLAGLKTCAYYKLQVPQEFIDVPIKTFNVHDWCDGIINIDWVSTEFNADNYSVERMMLSTLKLAR